MKDRKVFQERITKRCKDLGIRKSVARLVNFKIYMCVGTGESSGLCY